MPKLIRVSVNLSTLDFIVERGQQIRHELTEAEKKELLSLREQLAAYGDFVSIGELQEEERNLVLAAQKRRSELEKRTEQTEIVWLPVPRDEVSSVVLVTAPEQIPIYVENMPNVWIEKLFKSEIIINDPKILIGAATEISTSVQPRAPSQEKTLYVRDASLSERMNKVRQIIYEIEEPLSLDGLKTGAKTFLDLVTMREEDQNVIVTPKKFLKDDWGPINNILKEIFGPDLWKTEGKLSRWIIKPAP